MTKARFLVPRRSAPAALLLACCLAPIAWAEEDPLEIDDEIVVSASLTDVAKERVGSSVTVIDREEIERRNKTTVLELLRTVPGIEVAQSGGPGKATSVFIRGGNSAHTLVTVDGVRLNNNTTGAFDFADLTAENVERIEVVRGPQSLIYGSEAVAGAINILTRRGSGDTQGYVRGALGNDEFSQFAAGVRGGDERFDYSLAVSRIETDSVSNASEAAGNTEVDPWENLNVSARLGGAFWGDGRIDAAFRYLDGETSLDGFTFGVGPTDDLNTVQDRQVATGALTFEKPVSERWTQSLIVSYVEEDLEVSDPDNPFSAFSTRGSTTAVETRADVTLSDAGSLSIGYRHEDREAENPGSFDESVELDSVFAENLWRFGDRVDLSLGLRYDDHSTFGDETTYRVAISAELAERVRFHGSLGTGFKAPTFNDLFFPFFGNANLLPETSEAFDLGFEFRSADRESLIVDVTYFDADYEDLIVFTFPGGFQNVANASSEGVELSLDWRASERLSLGVTHTYNETEDLATGLQLSRRPENKSTISLAFDATDRLRGSLAAFIVRDRIEFDGTTMDDYERVDLSLDYAISERFRPFLRVENLLDEDYVEIPGFTTPGLTAALGVHLDF